MYRTDKPFMKNPATASSRIYVGNLAETVVPDSLEEKFSNHGTILGLVLQRGFGFIQFESDDQAQAAIANEHATMFHGRKINVKQAIDNAKAKHNLYNQQQQQQKYPPNNGPMNNNNPPPLMKEEVNKPQNEPMQRPPPGPTPGPNTQQPPQNAPPLNVQPPQRDNDSPIRKPDDGPPDKRAKRINKPRMPPKRDFRDDYREDMPPPYFEPIPAYNPPYHPPIIDKPERNDCEIIVVSKALTEYAEYIEQRLKSLGLIVDLLFPNEDVPIGRVLANISSRGCLYAILVMPQNEEHRSLTLNILHGVAEEHRNMPIDDAFLLITRNFEAYMRGEKNLSGKDGDSMTLTMKHPEHLQVILNLLAENRQISSTQYDKLISYIQDKRELQSQFELSEGIDSGLEPEVKNKQAELQNRIMSILNKKAEDAPPKVVEEAKPASGPTPLLNDPSVQKALDSLLLGDMFKSLK